MFDHVHLTHCSREIMASEVFAFNFSVPGADSVGSHASRGRQASACGKQPSESSTGDSDSVPESKEIPVLPFHELLLDHVSTLSYSVQDSAGVCLHYVDAGTLHAALAELKTHSDPESESCKVPSHSLDSFPAGLDSILRLLDSQHTDLIPGVYEGGMKVWECAFDLVSYLSECGMELSGKRVMELGCGAGLPAIYTLMKGAESVAFQDFNSEVLHSLTIPNVLLNETSKRTSKNDRTGMATNCRFYSGDWTDFTSKLLKSHSNSTYDIILASETIYSQTSQAKLLATMKQLVTPRTGRVLVAAKTYYFGVGGSVGSFKELLDKDGFFQWREVQVTGSEVPRVVLELRPMQDQQNSS